MKILTESTSMSQFQTDASQHAVVFPVDFDE
jgi:gamma-glutamyl hydrolase